LVGVEDFFFNLATSLANNNTASAVSNCLGVAASSLFGYDCLLISTYYNLFTKSLLINIKLAVYKVIYKHIKNVQ